MKQKILELLHLFSGLVGTVVVAWLAAWAVPNVKDTIWIVAWVSMLMVVFMAVRPLRLAWRVDQQGTPLQMADGQLDSAPPNTFPAMGEKKDSHLG
ncbi:MAG: hypothetical protein ABI240_15935 [Sphingomonas sp.]